MTFYSWIFYLIAAVVIVATGMAITRRNPVHAVLYLVEFIACASVLGSFVAALMAFLKAGDYSYTFSYFKWFAVGDFVAAMDVYYDPMAAIMALMVIFVSSLIHIYSVSFMQEDEDYVRYFCCVSIDADGAGADH